MGFLKKMGIFLAAIAAIVIALAILLEMIMPGSASSMQLNMMIDRFLMRVLTNERFLGMVAVLVGLIFLIRWLGGGGHHHTS